MTYEAIVREVAQKYGVAQKKAHAIVADVLGKSAKLAFDTGKGPRLPSLGKLVARDVRSHGRRPDGSKWETVPRQKLAISTRLVHEVKNAAESAAA